jgi:GNAT superfamily N-acetyltransferase
MKETETWVVRDGDEKDLEGILSLRKIVFGDLEKDKLDPRFWRWEFVENPDGKAFIYIVEIGDKIVGHFADIPRRFSVEGETVLGTLSLDLMVHPDFWRKGAFSELGKYAARRVQKENGLFMTAYPIREQTIKGLKKIGWEEIVELPVLVYPIRFRGIVSRYLRFPGLGFILGGMARIVHLLLFRWKGRNQRLKEVEIDQVHEIDGAFDRFLEKASSFTSVMGIRDRRFLTWRYFKHPTRSYTLYRARKAGEMMGYIVLRKVDLLQFNSAVIVDLLASDGEVLEALVGKGIEWSHGEGADLLAFMVPGSHPSCEQLKSLGFLQSLKSFLFMIYPHARENELLQPGKWYVTWGDTDVI